MRPEITHATPSDVPALVDLGAHFLAASPYAGIAPLDRDAIGNALNVMMATGCVLVARRDGEIVGGLVGVLGPLWFAQGVRVATELAWFVAPEARGDVGLPLLLAFEQWGRSAGAKLAALSDMIEEGGFPLGEYALRRMQYATVERMHVKELN